MAWRSSVNIAQYLRDDDTSLPERADKISKEFAAAGFYRTYAGGDLLNHVDELKEQAETGDPDYFDVPLSRIYDWCDEHRVWCGL